LLRNSAYVAHTRQRISNRKTRRPFQQFS
jgi:hypothetical protein